MHKLYKQLYPSPVSFLVMVLLFTSLLHGCKSVGRAIEDNAPAIEKSLGKVEAGAADAEKVIPNRVAVIHSIRPAEVQSAIAQNPDLYSQAQIKYQQRVAETGKGSINLAEEFLNEEAQTRGVRLSKETTQVLAAGLFGGVVGGGSSAVAQSFPSSQIPQRSQTVNSNSDDTNATIGGEAGSKNIRSGPGTKFTSQYIANSGDRVRILSSSKDDGGYTWYKVYVPKSGADGWIAAQLINPD